MTTYYLTMQHVATGIKYTQPIVAGTLAEAKQKARDWPYNTAGDYVVL